MVEEVRVRLLSFLQSVEHGPPLGYSFLAFSFLCMKQEIVVKVTVESKKRLTIFLALSFAWSAFDRTRAIQKVIVETQLTIILFFKLFLRLKELALEKEALLLEAEQEVLHPLDPGVVNCLTDRFAHQLYTNCPLDRRIL